MEKENSGYTTFVGSFRKIYATIPQELFVRLQDSGVLRPGKFDTFVAQAFFEKLASIEVIEDSGSAKKPRKKKVSTGVEAV